MTTTDQFPLETLVPPLELCEKIPKGSFAESVFAWSYSCDKRIKEPFVDRREDIEFCRRDLVNAPPVYPAPTLSEILAAVGAHPNVGIARVSCFGGEFRVSAQNERGNCSFPLCLDDNPAAAALQLWLEVNQKGNTKGKEND